MFIQGSRLIIPSRVQVVCRTLCACPRLGCSRSFGSLPELTFRGKVFHVESRIEEEQSLQNMDRILTQQSISIGFDTEWPPAIPKITATPRATLFQLCLGVPGQEPVVLLYRAPRDMMPLRDTYPFLVDMLTTAEIPKATQGAGHEVRALMKHFDLHPQGFMCLRCVAADLMPALGPMSLADLVAMYAGHRLLKSKVRMSKWDAWPLSPVQATYAAVDAYASYCVLKTLQATFGEDAVASACSRVRQPQQSVSLEDLSSSVRKNLKSNPSVGRETADAIVANTTCKLGSQSIHKLSLGAAVCAC